MQINHLGLPLFSSSSHQAASTYTSSSTSQSQSHLHPTDTGGRKQEIRLQSDHQLASSSSSASTHSNDADDSSSSSSSSSTKFTKNSLRGNSFQSYNLPSYLFKGIMRMGYKLPTPIQRQCIPLLLQGKDVIMKARTGSGKTAAFLIPLIAHLSKTCASTFISSSSTSSSSSLLSQTVRAVILSPTRELAEQTFQVTQQLIKYIPSNISIRPCLLIGGSSLNAQFETLDHGPNVLIATPGRLLHHLIEIGFTLRSTEILVYDEADRLLELGFAAQLNEIHKKLSLKHQTILVSATMPSVLMEFTRSILQDAHVIKLDTDTQLSPTLDIALLSCRESEKIAALLLLLQTSPLLQAPKSILLFAATRHRVEFLHAVLQAANLTSAPVYGELDAAARKINVAKFKAGKVRTLIVTDLAARGIDLPFLDAVINFDFPSKPKLFVHRCGRVARAGKLGVAVCLINHQELPYMLDLQLFLARPFIFADNNQLYQHSLQHQQQISQAAVPSSSASSNSITFGHLPSSQLIEYNEQVNNILQDAALQRLQAVADRSFNLYKKTRPSASNASAARAKQTSWPKGVHPWFTASISNKISTNASSCSPLSSSSSSSPVSNADQVNNDLSADAMRQAISSYQTRSTIFEINGVERDHVVHVIRRHLHQKREKIENQSNFNTLQQEADHNNSISTSTFTTTSHLSHSSNAPTECEINSHRDREHWIDVERSNVAVEEGLAMESGANAAIAQLSAASMDILGDEANSLLMKTRTKSVWNQKKRNYVKVMEGGDTFKAQRNEQGELVRGKSQPALYEKWRKHKKAKADAKFRAESYDNEAVDQELISSNDKSKAPVSSNKVRKAAFKGPQELRDANLVRKQRLQKEKQKFRQKYLSQGKKIQKKSR